MEFTIIDLELDMAAKIWKSIEEGCGELLQWADSLELQGRSRTERTGFDDYWEVHSLVFSSQLWGHEVEVSAGRDQGEAEGEWHKRFISYVVQRIKERASDYLESESSNLEEIRQALRAVPESEAGRVAATG